MTKTLKEKAKEKYSRIQSINCPAFPNETIVFNAKGFNHLFYKGARSGRNKVSIAVRIRLLDRAVELLTKSMFFQEEISILGPRGNYKKQKNKGCCQTDREREKTFLERHSFLEEIEIWDQKCPQ